MSGRELWTLFLLSNWRQFQIPIWKASSICPLPLATQREAQSSAGVEVGGWLDLPR